MFIVDISGSMEEKTRSGESRFIRARRELIGALEGLGPNCLFNVITFSSDARRWLERIAQIKPETIKTAGGYLDQAKAHINKLRAGGGTNLYGAVKLAFMDPDIDTIYLLTDGEPTMGEVIDAAAIRLYVQSWNKHRKVVINTLAFGGTFPILQWLAADSGGTYRYIP
jgi:Mg-chelatase subunit ChlD